jgi:hypothetical protein
MESQPLTQLKFHTHGATFENILNKYTNLNANSMPIRLDILVRKLKDYFGTLINKSFSFGFFYLQGFAFILFIDACLTDDEPL